MRFPPTEKFTYISWFLKRGETSRCDLDFFGKKIRTVFHNKVWSLCNACIYPLNRLYDYINKYYPIRPNHSVQLHQILPNTVSYQSNYGVNIKTIPHMRGLQTNKFSFTSPCCWKGRPSVLVVTIPRHPGSPKLRFGMTGPQKTYPKKGTSEGITWCLGYYIIRYFLHQMPSSPRHNPSLKLP